MTRKQLRIKYGNQRKSAKERGIDWQFTFESWILWWGEDIYLRGPHKGQLVMARYGDVGPYHPDNVRKITCTENAQECWTGRKHSTDTLTKMSQAQKGKIVSAETKQRQSENSGKKKAIQTPLGQFDSLVKAAKYHGVTTKTIRCKIKEYPNEYYYL